VHQLPQQSGDRIGFAGIGLRLVTDGSWRPAAAGAQPSCAARSMSLRYSGPCLARLVMVDSTFGYIW